MMSRILDINIIVFLSFLQAGVILPSENLKNWKNLHDNKIWIGWKHSGGIDWARAKSTLDAPIKDVRRIIEDKKNYPNIIFWQIFVESAGKGPKTTA